MSTSELQCQATRCVILAVDDRPDNLFVFQQLMAVHLPECEVVTAADAGECLELAFAKAPDGIMLDVQMPGTNGIEVCRRLKSDERTAHVPVILVTAHRSSPRIRAAGLEAGADDFISKPIDNDELVARVKVMLRVKRSEDELRRLTRHLQELVDAKARALCESQERYRAIAEDIPLSICRFLPGGEITYVNAACARYMARIGVDGTGAAFADLIPAADRQLVLADIAALTVTAPDRVHEVRVSGSDADGEWQRWTTRALFAADGQLVAYQAIGEDISERRRLEQGVIHLERMRASGELAAGVSHNLNNVLTAVLGPAQLLLRRYTDPQVRQEAATILAAGRRAQTLVRRLNQAVRVQQGDPLGPVVVEEQVREALRMAHPRLKDEPEARGIHIQVITDLGQTTRIRGHAHDLSDAILNLLLNAVDAMPKGGTITIQTMQEGDFVLLTVADTGTGMSEETRRRVFEPFFTTKMDVGSGLGLSTVHAMVTRWGGGIQVRSVVDEGTTFTLRFPVWTQAAAGEQARDRTELPALSGKLLIVEDDAGVSRLLEHLLADTHILTMARDGGEALAQLVPGAFHAALIDLGLPTMTGDQLAAQIRRTDPRVATVMITGWTLEATDPRRADFDFYLQKPFDDLRQVEEVVARALVLHREREAARE